MTPVGGVRTAIRRGLVYIATKQAEDGSFSSISSPSRTPFSKAATYHTTFVPALILAALSKVDDPMSQATCGKLATWLQAQKSDGGTYNYWAKNTTERRTLPYPDDLDDSFCAFIGLYEYNPTLIDGSILGQAVNILLATETQVGGPYRTWLVPKDSDPAWLDVDLAVNTNVAAFLQLVAKPTPTLMALMEQAIAKGSFTSPYYPSPYPLFYYLARAYRGSRQQQLIKHIIRAAKDGIWGTPLQTALAICALKRLGHADDLRRAITFLLEQQQPDGSWPAEAFCIDPAQKGKTYYHGASTLTTALALEALHSYAKQINKPIHAPAKKHDAHQSDINVKLHTRIMLAAEQQLQQLDARLRAQTLRVLQQTAKTRSGHEIILLAHEFAQSLYAIPAHNDTMCERLGLANLYGWTAYTIYDDFLDGEGDQALLPVANVTHRLSVDNFESALPHDKMYAAYVRHTFNLIDSANAWEVANCRFIVKDDCLYVTALPRYGQLQRLADRSAGHALGPMSLLITQNSPPNTRPAQYIERAMRHYLIARQLSDDIHDWEQDTRAGHCTYVVGLILKQLACSGPQPFSTLLPAMQHHFWHHTLTDVCNTITQHTQQTRRYTAQSKLLQSDNYLTKLCDRIDQTVAKTLQEQATAKQFLTTYRSKS